MTGAVAGANIVLGFGYLVLAVIVFYELIRQWREPGVWQFGAALTAIAFTCGPHHVAHGIHVGFEGQAAGRLDLVTVLMGMPPAAVFVWLRVEALLGRRGDRVIGGTPAWIQLMPAAAGLYVGMVLAVGAGLMVKATALSFEGLLSVASAVVFGWIAVVLLRTQLQTRAAAGGWSTSGLALLGLFATCAVMHAAAAMEAAAQVRPIDVHLATVDGLGVLAAVWFLVVVRAMTREAADEWGAVEPTAAGNWQPMGGT